MFRVFFSLGLCLLVPALVQADAPFRFPEGKHGTASLRYQEGLPVLSVSGTPEEIGDGVGVLALKPGKRVMEYPRGLLRALRVEGSWKLFASAGTGMFRRVPSAYQRELDAMVKGSGVERESAIVGNTLFDLKKFLACSAIVLEADRSATRGPLLARNLDYPPLGYIHQYSLVSVYRPKGKRPFVSVGFPGLIGVLSGMNDAGLTVAVLEVFDIKSGETHFDATGIPYALCLRTLLEECSTIDEAQKKLEGMRRTCTINVAIADRKGGALLEVSPRRVIRRVPQRGIGVCTNHFASAAFRPERPINVDRSFERFTRLEGLRKAEARLTVEDLRRELDAVNLGTHTLQTMAFDPVSLTLHLSIGPTPASKGPMRALPLRGLFR